MKKAVIIGAGPAGLTAAYELLKKTDIKPVILEESPYIGGISRTAEYKGNRMDLGGHRFFTKNEQVQKIWEELMPLQGSPSKDDLLLHRDMPLNEGGPDPEKTDRVFLVRNRVSRIFFLRRFFDYPISIKPQTFINMGFVRTVKAGCGYLYSSVFKRKENSLEDFYINRFGKPLYEMFFEDYTEKLWGIHPSKIAPDWGAQRVKGLSLGKILLEILTKPFRKNKQSTETSLIEQFIYPKKGPGQLWELMAEEIRRMGGEIHMETGVDGIRTACENGERKVTGVYAKGQLFEGDYYFSSMPIKDLFEAMDQTDTKPAIPRDVKEVAENLPYRDFITVGLLVKKLEIINQTKMKTVGNIVPDCWIYIQERDVKIGRLQVFNNWSPYMPKDYEKTVWVGLEYFCNEGDPMWNMSSDEFIDFAAGELEKIHVIRKENILDATHIRVKKAYPAYFGTYAQFDKVEEYLKGFSNLYCVGRNGQHRYNNMDHSMLTAIEAVNLIIEGRKDQSVLWKVNTEKEYHETKEE